MNRLDILNTIYEIYSSIQSKNENLKIKQLENKQNHWKNEMFKKIWGGESTEKKLHYEWLNNKISGESWEQFVRLGIDLPKFKNMFYRTRVLLKKYSDPGQYFKVSFEDGVYQLPDRISEFENLQRLYLDFLDIYKNIEKQINFERISKVSTSNMMSGNVDWRSTLNKSNMLTPTKFETRKWNVDFATPENQLLIYGALWLKRMSLNIRRAGFEEPLNNDESHMILKIFNGIKNILNFFPFPNVVDKVIREMPTDNDHGKIVKLHRLTEQRLKNGFIPNIQYNRLVKWFRKSSTFNFSDIAQLPSTLKFQLQATKNIDTMYEVWIFFEFLNFIAQKTTAKLLSNDEDQWFNFRIEKTDCTMFYEKKFSRSDDLAWASDHKPDFSVLSDKEVIAVFDAKNYKKQKDAENPKNKILAYMVNLCSGYGVVLWPKKNEEIYTPSSDIKSKHYKNLKICVYTLNPYELNNFQDIENTFDKIYRELEKRVLMNEYFDSSLSIDDLDPTN